MWPVRAQAPPVEAMGRFYPHSARRRPRLGRSVDGPLAWMNLIPWNNEYTYNVSITTGVGEGGLLRLLSPGSLGFQVAWDFRLVSRSLPSINAMVLKRGPRVRPRTESGRSWR